MKVQNIQSSTAFGGKLYSAPVARKEFKATEKESLKLAKEELKTVLTKDELKEFKGQVSRLKEYVKDKNIKVGIFGCPSSDPHTNELRIVFRQILPGGDYWNGASAFLVPNYKKRLEYGSGRFGFYEQSEMGKMMDTFISELHDYPKKKKGV